MGQQAQAGEGPSTGQRAPGRSGRRPDRLGDPGSRALLTRPACPLQSFLYPLARGPSTPFPSRGRSGQASGLLVAWSVGGVGPVSSGSPAHPCTACPCSPLKGFRAPGERAGPTSTLPWTPAPIPCTHFLRPLMSPEPGPHTPAPARPQMKKQRLPSVHGTAAWWSCIPPACWAGTLMPPGTLGRLGFAGRQEVCWRRLGCVFKLLPKPLEGWPLWYMAGSSPGRPAERAGRKQGWAGPGGSGSRFLAALTQVRSRAAAVCAAIWWRRQGAPGGRLEALGRGVLLGRGWVGTCPSPAPAPPGPRLRVPGRVIPDSSQGPGPSRLPLPRTPPAEIRNRAFLCRQGPLPGYSRGRGGPVPGVNPPGALHASDKQGWSSPASSCLPQAFTEALLGAGQ